MTDDMDARARVKRLEADMQAICDESRALRQGGPFAEDALELHDALERAIEIAANAHTPPPESEPKYERCPSCGGSGLQLNMAGEPDECADCRGNGVVDAHPTPEQTDYLVEQVKAMPEWAADKIRGLMRGEDAAVCRQTGDALAGALDALVLKAGKEPCSEEYSTVRQALTASGVPEGWKWQTSRDVTDEYVTSLIAPDGTTVYVGEDDKAIAWLERLLSANSGVPKGDYHEGFEEGMRAGHGVPEDNND